ncbi:MAG: ribonuclease Z [Chloroflexi bacterium]|nr:ribonuclease Z [Chloroflexota bacterium]
MFEVVFLGTSASAPSIQRGLSSQIVMYKDYRFLIDCGEGTQRQILQSGLGFRRLDKILLTHGHLDHILGLAGLISTFSRWDAMDRIEIWGGKWTLERVHDLIFGVVLRGDRPPVNIELHPIEPGLLYDEKDFQIYAFPVEHRGPDCFGFSFVEKSRRPFLNEKAEALGVPRGPERRDLVDGKSIKLQSGEVVHPDDVLGEVLPGTKICFTGDTGNAHALLEDVYEADLLVSEATYLDSEADLARRFGHLTAKQAAELAINARVRYLLLTHVSRRYFERDIIAEAQALFEDAFVVRDFDHFRVRNGQPLEKLDNGR